MCGILGQVVPDGASVNRARLLAANDRMASRGPDGAGEFLERNVGLAMRRLAVIDVEGGAQPLFARGGEVVAFQNGEIYNHAALARELAGRGARFVTRSDTEVLAHGFDAWGIDGLLDRVDGMFACALLDRRARTLWLARDRFGEKPLFCSRAGGGFAFASSIDALRELVGGTSELDPRALDDYLALHFVPGRRTIFRDVWRALPGELVRVDLATLAVERRRWWTPPAPVPRDASDEELLAELDAAVRSRLIADVPVGVFLSGGLDSSLVAALAARAQGGIATFTMGFGGPGEAAGDADESRHAERVARHVGSTHHRFRFDAGRFAALLPQVAAALDEPVGDPAQLPLHWLCREARRTVTVVLSGEGADELFGGYDYYSAAAPVLGLRERIARWRAGGAATADAAGSRLVAHDGGTAPSGFPLVLARAQRRRLLPDVDDGAADDHEATLLEKLASARDPLQRRSLADAMTWLPDDLLVKLDRMSMAHGLEGRAPYLAPRVAELALALPPARRSTFLRRKVALAAAAAPLLPPEIISRRKHGFVLPMREWLRDHFAAFGSVERWIAERPLPLLDRRALAEFVREALAGGRGRTRALFSLTLLSEWWAARAPAQRASAAR